MSGLKKSGSMRGHKEARRAVEPARSRSELTARRAASFAASIHATDRKSTRLNSSHSQISYAVFCLKKKTPEHHSQSKLACRLLLAEKKSGLTSTSDVGLFPRRAAAPRAAARFPGAMPPPYHYPVRH